MYKQTLDSAFYCLEAKAAGESTQSLVVGVDKLM